MFIVHSHFRFLSKILSSIWRYWRMEVMIKRRKYLSTWYTWEKMNHNQKGRGKALSVRINPKMLFNIEMKPIKKNQSIWQCLNSFSKISTNRGRASPTSRFLSKRKQPLNNLSKNSLPKFKSTGIRTSTLSTTKNYTKIVSSWWRSGRSTAS